MQARPRVQVTNRTTLQRSRLQTHPSPRAAALPQLEVSCAVMRAAAAWARRRVGSWWWAEAGVQLGLVCCSWCWCTAAAVVAARAGQQGSRWHTQWGCVGCPRQRQDHGKQPYSSPSPSQYWCSQGVQARRLVIPGGKPAAAAMRVWRACPARRGEAPWPLCLPAACAQLVLQCRVLSHHASTPDR